MFDSWWRLLHLCLRQFSCLVVEAGSRPGRRVTFLARPRVAGRRNVTQRMRPDFLRPCAALRANLRHAIQSAVRQNSLCAARAAQTVAASQCTKLLHSTVQQPAPRACRRRRGHKGRYGDSFFVFLIAASAIWISARGQLRHNSGRPPVPARVDAPAARGSGCGHWHRRVPMLRALTRRRLSERSGVPRSEFGGTAD